MTAPTPISKASRTCSRSASTAPCRSSPRSSLKGRGGRNGGTPAALKELGDHPDGGEITVRDGNYGPYVNFDKVNATLPKGKDPMSVTLDEAVAMIAEKAAKGGGGKKPFRKARPSRRQEAAAKKPAAKKPAKKKA